MRQVRFSDFEYSSRKTKREGFLEIMEEIIPWEEWGDLIASFYPTGRRGRPPKGIEKMLRMYLLQCWFDLSDEGVEDAIYDSYAMQIIYGRSATFDFFDIRMSFGLTKAEALAYKSCAADWDLVDGFSNKYSGDGSTTFHTTAIKVADVGETVEERKAKIISLLEDHPEGIVIYCKYTSGNHAILLTEYDPDTDTFYACDSVDVKGATTEEGKYPEKLSGTFLYRNLNPSEKDVANGVNKILSNLVDADSAGCIWYVSSVTW